MVPQKYFAYDEINTELHTVYGMTVDIFVTTIGGNQSSVDTIVNLHDAAQKNKAALVIANIKTDHNYLDEAIDHPSSLFRICDYILILLSVLGLMHSVKVTIKYYQIKNGSLELNYCSVSLTVTVIANLARVARAIDPSGVSGNTE